MFRKFFIVREYNIKNVRIEEEYLYMSEEKNICKG